VAVSCSITPTAGQRTSGPSTSSGGHQRPINLLSARLRIPLPLAEARFRFAGNARLEATRLALCGPSDGSGTTFAALTASCICRVPLSQF
jgi:hypothetical protein